MDDTEMGSVEVNSGSIQDAEDALDNREGEGMEAVASMLKRTREEQGISLKDAERDTRVPTHYLQFLEGEGDPRMLADILYLIPFLRTYSLFLGLDPAVTIPQFIVGVQKGETLGNVLIPQTRRFFSRTALVLLVLGGLVTLLLLWIAG